MSRELPFRYVTLAGLRAAGVSSAVLPDKDATELIEEKSALINRVTEQWFQPSLETIRLSGDGGSRLAAPQLIPTLWVEDIKLVDEGLPLLSLFDLAEIILLGSRRYIGLRPRAFLHGTARLISEIQQAHFPRGIGNIEMKAAFGWVEDFREGVATTTTAVVANDDTSIALTSVAGMRVGDTINIRDPADRTHQARAEIVKITGTTITCDPITALFSLPIGSDVYCFGRVPRTIQRATIVLVREDQSRLGSAAAIKAAQRRNLLSERTDNYAYTLGAATAGDPENVDATTGVLQVDNMLANFSAPNFIGLI